MQHLKNKILERDGKKPIVYDVAHNNDHKPKPVVIFCHGYKGFKDWGAWNLAAEEFAKEEFFFLKFNFSHNGGTVEQPIDFPDLEAFAQNNYSKELDDLQDIIHFMATTKRFHDEADVRNISLIGHSRGGGIVLIKAQEDSRVNKVITWAGVSDYKVRFHEDSETFKQWRKTGRRYVENGRTKQQMPHDWQFYEDFKQNEKRLTIKGAVEDLKKPLLILHGSSDPTVSVSEAKNLKDWSQTAQLIIIENTDHVFGTNHPWEKKTLPEPFKKVLKKTMLFLKSQ